IWFRGIFAVRNHSAFNRCCTVLTFRFLGIVLFGSTVLSFHLFNFRFKNTHGLSHVACHLWQLIGAEEQKSQHDYHKENDWVPEELLGQPFYTVGSIVQLESNLLSSLLLTGNGIVSHLPNSVANRLWLHHNDLSSMSH